MTREELIGKAKRELSQEKLVDLVGEGYATGQQATLKLLLAVLRDQIHSASETGDARAIDVLRAVRDELKRRFNAT
jgi:hypothetical protein